MLQLVLIFWLDMQVSASHSISGIIQTTYTHAQPTVSADELAVVRLVHFANMSLQNVR